MSSSDRSQIVEIHLSDGLLIRRLPTLKKIADFRIVEFGGLPLVAERRLSPEIDRIVSC